MVEKTVIVGCRIPSGLILQLRDKDGIVYAEKAVVGSACSEAPYYREFHAGFTEVDAELWESWKQWAATNKYAPFESGAVFAAPTKERALAIARERQFEKTLMEGLNVTDPKSDPRMTPFSSASLKKFKED